jgi:hypothetical protein
MYMSVRPAANEREVAHLTSPSNIIFRQYGAGAEYLDRCISIINLKIAPPPINIITGVGGKSLKVYNIKDIL